MTSNDMSFWRRRRTRIVFTIAFLLFMNMFLLTRSFVLSPIIASTLKSKFGTEVKVRGAKWEWGRSVSMDEVVLKATGVEGLASEVVSFQDVSIEFDSVIPIFNTDVRNLEIQSVRIRIAESLENAGEFNFSHLLQSPNYFGTQETQSPTSIKQSRLLPRTSLQRDRWRGFKRSLRSR